MKRLNIVTCVMMATVIGVSGFLTSRAIGADNKAETKITSTGKVFCGSGGGGGRGECFCGTARFTLADEWLGIVDEGKYGESWKKASEYFRNAVNQDQWEQSLQAVRKPLGKLVSRKLKNTSYKTSLPGAPDGKYVVVEFETSFENKKSAIETVTSMMDKDDQWRVCGYFIK